jgi:hypothetical protein
MFVVVATFASRKVRCRARGGEGLKEGDELIGFHGTIERECRCGVDSVQSEYSFS